MLNCQHNYTRYKLGGPIHTCHTERVDVRTQYNLLPGDGNVGREVGVAMVTGCGPRKEPKSNEMNTLRQA